MLNNKRGEIVTLLAIGTSLIVALAAVISSSFINTSPQTTTTAAAGLCGKSCPGNQCASCGIGGFWDQGCWDFTGKQPYEMFSAGTSCTPCGDPNLICKNTEQGSCSAHKPGYECGNDSCLHQNTSKCGGGSEPTATPIPPGGEPTCSSTSDNWYCAGECANQTARNAFNGTYPPDGSDEWRAEKAKNCNISASACSTASCGGTNTCKAADGKTYQVGTNYCDGDELMNCSAANSPKVVKDCGSLGCNTTTNTCNTSGGGGGGTTVTPPGGGGGGGTNKSCVDTSGKTHASGTQYCDGNYETKCINGKPNVSLCGAPGCNTETNTCNLVNDCENCKVLAGSITIDNKDIKLGDGYTADVYNGQNAIIKGLETSRWSWDRAESGQKYFLSAKVRNANGVLLGQESVEKIVTAGNTGTQNIVLPVNIDASGDNGDGTGNGEMVTFSIDGNLENRVVDANKRGNLEDLQVSFELRPGAGFESPKVTVSHNGYFIATLEVPKENVRNDFTCYLSVTDANGNVVLDGNKNSLPCKPDKLYTLGNSVNDIRYEKPTGSTGVPPPAGTNQTEGSITINPNIVFAMQDTCKLYDFQGGTLELLGPAAGALTMSTNQFNADFNPADNTHFFDGPPIVLTKNDPNKDLITGLFTIRASAIFGDGTQQSVFVTEYTGNFNNIEKQGGVVNWAPALVESDSCPKPPPGDADPIKVDSTFWNNKDFTDPVNREIAAGKSVMWVNDLDYRIKVGIYDDAGKHITDFHICQNKNWWEVCFTLDNTGSYTFEKPGYYEYFVCDVSNTGGCDGEPRFLKGKIQVQ